MLSISFQLESKCVTILPKALSCKTCQWGKSTLILWQLKKTSCSPFKIVRFMIANIIHITPSYFGCHKSWVEPFLHSYIGSSSFRDLNWTYKAKVCTIRSLTVAWFCIRNLYDFVHSFIPLDGLKVRILPYYLKPFNILNKSFILHIIELKRSFIVTFEILLQQW